MGAMNICSACERHVYVDEPACPFCGCTEARLPPGPRLSGRLSRAAAHAARAAIFAGAVSCSEAHGPDADAAANDDGGAVEDGAVADAAADAGPVDDGGPSFDGEARRDAGDADAAVADAAADASGEEADADVPIYGGVFPDPRKRAVV